MTTNNTELLAELGQLENFLGLLFDKLDVATQASQAGTNQIQRKVDEWILTNRAMAELSRDLLRSVTHNSEALNTLTNSYENNATLSQGWMPQLQAFEHTVQNLNDVLLAQSQQEGTQAMLIQQVTAQLAEFQPLMTQLQAHALPLHQGQQANRGGQPTAMGRFPGMSLSIELVRRAMAPLAVLGGLLVAVGSGVGFAYAQIQQPPPPLYVTETQEPLTLEQAELLAWATTQEGQFARNLMDWNTGILDSLTCTDEVKRLGVTLKVQGRPASYGFCTVWVVPPNQRQFEPEE